MPVNTHIHRLAAAGATSVLLTAANAGALGAQETLAIRDARVFDGERVHPAVTVLVRDGRIAAVGPAVEVPAGADVVDGTGHTLLPGFIDAHTHTLAPEVLKTALAFGVTTQLDMFTAPETVTRLRAEQEAGEAFGRAHLFSSGILATAPGGHGTEYGIEIPTLATPDEAQAFVDARIAEGSDYIKIVYDDGSAYGMHFPTLNEATLHALIEAAHARGKLAVVHTGSLADARAAIEAGADGLAHLWLDGIPPAALVREMAERDVFVSPTLTVLESVTGAPPGAALLDDPRIAPYVGPEGRTNLGSSFPVRSGSPGSYRAAKASLRRLARGGVRILAGTDAPNPGTWYGASLHRELQLLVDAGLSPLEALRAATAAAATAFDLGDRGRILRGRRADLVLVEGDPTTNIRASRNIVAVWKAGRRFDRGAYRDAVAERVAAAEAAAARAPIAPGGQLVSDFDDGELTATFGLGWEETTDAMMGGRSTCTLALAEGGAGGTTGALRVTGDVAPDLDFAWAGAMFFPGAQPMTPRDLSATDGIHFQARGDGKVYRVMVFTSAGGQQPQMRTFTAAAEWQQFTFAWAHFDTDGSDVAGIAFVAGPAPGPYELRIDQVEVR